MMTMSINESKIYNSLVGIEDIVSDITDGCTYKEIIDEYGLVLVTKSCINYLKNRDEIGEMLFIVSHDEKIQKLLNYLEPRSKKEYPELWI